MASVELTARNRAKRRQDDSPISTGYPGILSHSIIKHADSAPLSNLLSIFGERQFPGGGGATLISTLFQPGGLHFYLQSTGSLARMAAQPFPHEEEIK